MFRDYGLMSGMRMIESANALEFYDVEETVKRSWRERLLAWPWKPWVATKTITVKRSKPAIYMTGSAIIYHPALKDRIYRKDGS